MSGTHGRPPAQECRLRLKRPCPPRFKSSTAFPRSCTCGLFPWAAKLSLRFQLKKYDTAYFFVRKRTSKKPTRGCSFVAELLTFGFRKAGTLWCQCVERCRTFRFAGWKRNARSATFGTLRVFEDIGEGFHSRASLLHDNPASRAPCCCFGCIGPVQTQDAYQEPFESPETVYRSCLDMQAFQQEVLRVVLLDTRLRRITAVDVSKGTLNESLGHPREVFRAAIVHSAYALAIVHNHPSGAMPYPVLCRKEH